MQSRHSIIRLDEMIHIPESVIILRQCGYSFLSQVGNSGSLLETQYGEEIDAHDVVIRFNHGITEGDQ